MELLLIRHAAAEPRSRDQRDKQRALTSRGIDRFSREVRGLERLELPIDRIYHSPWLRAAQTAELLAPITSGKRIKTSLLADDPGDELLSVLSDNPAGSRIALVGHQPWLGDLLALLVTGTTSTGDQFVFKKGAVAWLEGAPKPGTMELRALFPPRTLRRLVTNG